MPSLPRSFARLLLAQLPDHTLDGEGETGFTAIWLARATLGSPAPLGPVLSYAQGQDGNYYAAVFSSRSLPQHCREGHVRVLSPALILDDTLVPHLQWIYRGVYSDTYGNCCMPIRFATIPKRIQRRFTFVLGPDYPHRPRARR